MITAAQLRPGATIRYQGQTYKVTAAEYHPGQGRMGGVSHTRLQNLDTGTFWEYSFRADLRFDEVPLEKRPLEFLYGDANHCCFMDPQSYEQIEVPKALVGDRVVFLEAGTKIAVDFVEGRPVSVAFPDMLEVQIGDTAPPTHAQADSGFKPAKLTNGVEVMVPQFVKKGDWIRLDLATRKYMDRARTKAT